MSGRECCVCVVVLGSTECSRFFNVVRTERGEWNGVVLLFVYGGQNAVVFVVRLGGGDAFFFQKCLGRERLLILVVRGGCRRGNVVVLVFPGLGFRL